nr:F0F1 ATP synthase subunit A [Arsenicicoccus piscis]
MAPSFATEDGGSFEPPAPAEFYQPVGTLLGVEITRSMVLALVAFVILAVWLLSTTRKAAVVPSKAQWMTEQIYDFVRNGISRDMIGSKDFMRFTPLLFALFVFILLSNLFGSLPLANFPIMSRIGFPMALVLIVYVIYHAVGIQKHGLGGYFKSMVPPGLPKAMVPMIFILELSTFFLVRPLTLCLRLFGNMFAGHMLMGVFILGSTYMMLSGSIGLMAASVGGWVMTFLMQLLEFLIQAIQAYVFTMLAASYFGGAVADEH